ncbi:hypothetical protein BDY19DRAFT_494932 [Irpex rosettiformis]|uniref:Uncharacterized protein n=1 Tax=Irpex rosettiformis TaxID=378272 RepID=A0ACB8UG18_9APHY|nr:hypothetical protein BDY19DRAFT_494932 [Irpex rosettiformis]
MATSATSSAPTAGVSASIWADKPMPPRSGWSKGSESGSGFRGAPRGGPRGRGRGGRGRGGTGGRSNNARAPTIPLEADAKKSNQDQKDQPKSTSQKPTTPPSPITTTSSQTNGSTKGFNKTKPPRKNSDQRPSRTQASLGVDTLNLSSSNTSSSPSISPRTPNRRKRSNAHKTAPAPPAAPTSHARRQSTASEQNSTHAVEKPPPAPLRELPPHMASAQSFSGPLDIAHNIDALVERVRAVAMDRPHTPGNHSHFDWAGDDEDDSLPDLDDWGVTSSLSTTGPVTEVTDGEKIGVSVISPILQGTLRPLPSIVDIDAPTPSIKLQDVSGAETKLKTKDEDISRMDSVAVEAKAETPIQETVTSDNNASRGNIASKATTEAPANTTERPKSPSPPRGLASSIHATHHSLSPPSPSPHRFPNPPRSGFNPSHNRAHTVGGRFKESNPESDRLKPNDTISHGRNHSTPHTGPGTVTAHARATHHTRPVISGDAISRLARSLGGAASKREREPAATANA